MIDLPYPWEGIYFVAGAAYVVLATCFFLEDLEDPMKQFFLIVVLALGGWFAYYFLTHGLTFVVVIMIVFGALGGLSWGLYRNPNERFYRDTRRKMRDLKRQEERVARARRMAEKELER